MPLLLAPSSLIKSNFMNGDHANFEAVIYNPYTKQLRHYFRKNDQPDRGWEEAQIVNQASGIPVIGAGAFCQSTFGKQGNYELVVPELGGLAHYWLDNDNIASPW